MMIYTQTSFKHKKRKLRVRENLQRQLHIGSGEKNMVLSPKEKRRTPVFT